MPGNAYAQKLTASLCAAYDPDFTPAFYRPYEAAAQTVLHMLDHARRRLPCREGESCVRALNYRLKSPSSIREKLRRKGLPVSVLSASSALRDIAGLRVVLASEEDVYRFAELLRLSPDAEMIDVHDYIAFPKPSGYRSLHVLLRVPVCLDGQIHLIPAEIQLRTNDMDVWASAEHEICYKPAARSLYSLKRICCT